MSERFQKMPLPCKQWAGRLAARHPGDLSPGERRALNAHVATCPACAAALAAYRAMDERIQALPAVEPLPAPAIDAVVSVPVAQTMASEGNAPVGHERRPGAIGWRVRPRRVARFASMAAAVLIVGALVGSFLLVLNMHRSQSGNEGAPTPVRSVPTAIVGKQALACPQYGTRAAVMPPLALGTDPNLIYVDNEQAASSPKSATAVLKRYDVLTHRTVSILKLPAATIIDAEVSPDGRWVMFTTQPVGEQYQLQLVRVDGKDYQTIACSSTEYLHVSWSPDQKWALMTENGSPSPFEIQLDIIGLATGSFGTYSFGTPGKDNYSFSPTWLSSAQFVVSDAQSDGAGHVSTTFYSLDLYPSQFRRPLSLPQQFTGPLPGAVDIASSEDGTGPYVSECGGGPKAAIPPCSISRVPAQGGGPQVMYTSPNLAISAIRAYGKGGLLVMVNNVAGDTSQNGVWKFNGVGLVRLYQTTASEPASFNLLAQDPWANVSRDGAWYALKVEAGGHDTLAIGSMKGGPLTTIATRGQTGWSQSGAVGWTTM